MAHEQEPLRFDEFARYLPQIFQQVKDRRAPVLVERDGDTFRLEMQAPEDIWKDCDPDRVQRALRASAGALSGVDIDELLHNLDAQREQGPSRFDGSMSYLLDTNIVLYHLADIPNAVALVSSRGTLKR